MFIRIKKIRKKGKVYEYAHLVEGLWKKKKEGDLTCNSRQIYKAILGPVFRFQKVSSFELEEFLTVSFKKFLETHSLFEIYGTLLGYVLFCRGFKNLDGLFLKEGIFVDFEKRVVCCGKKNVVLKVEDVGGYICQFTLTALFEIKKIQTKKEGLLLLRSLKRVGIHLQPDQFFLLVDKLLREV